jgi:hypothetical protein
MRKSYLEKVPPGGTVRGYIRKAGRVRVMHLQYCNKIKLPLSSVNALLGRII